MSLRRVALTALTLIATVACAPQPTTPGTPQPVRWLIPAGQHSATGERVELTTTDALSFRVEFDSSAAYTSLDPANQYDWNKLRGLSDCGQHHQTASARFGWRWNGSAVELAAYTYVGGVRHDALLGSVAPGTQHELRLAMVGATYEFTLDGATTTVPRGCSDTGLVKYQLWPYFGGDEVAPHAITISILER